MPDGDPVSPLDAAAITSGGRVVVVGSNGSGTSTLIQLAWRRRGLSQIANLIDDTDILAFLRATPSR